MISSLFLKGIAFAIGSYFFMALYSIFLKLASTAGGNSVWVNFIAYFSGTIALSPLLIRKGPAFLRTNHFSTHVLRAFCGVLSSYMYTLSMSFIPLVNATLFFNTSPLFIPIFSIFLLKAKVSRRDWLAIFVGFLGVIVIIRPTSDILKQSGDFIALGSGLFLGLGYIFIKMLTKTDSRMLITFYFCFLASIMQGPFLFIYPHIPPLACIGWSIGAGLMVIMVQLFLAAAYSYAEATKVGALQYSSLIFVGIIGWILWGNVPKPMDILGMVLVIAGGVMIVLQSAGQPSTRTSQLTT